MAPIVVPFALIAGIFGANKETVDRTPEDVAGFIGDLIDGSGGEWDWDEFESVPITDPALDARVVLKIQASTPALAEADNF